ncbi:MAG: TMEM175 family protein [Bacteroidota bacterium]
MKTNRLEAFSDGVLAIIITIMVLELHAPEAANLESLLPEVPTIISFLLSFIYLGTYWNNHHHMMHVTEQVNGKILWANLHLLFWLSLIPFVTTWMGEHYLEAAPVGLYGFVLLMSGLAYYLLQGFILRHHDSDFILRKVIGKDFKGKASLVLYLIGIAGSFLNTWIGIICYVAVLILWVVPDRRIETNL